MADQPQVPVEFQFQALLEGAPDAVVIVDQDGRIVIANSQAERIFGYPRGELIGRPVELLLPENLATIHQRHRAAYAANPHTRPMGSGLDLVVRRRDGSTFPVEISLSAQSSASGLLITAVIRDVTEHKRMADELERQVQLRTQRVAQLEEQQRRITERLNAAEAGMLQAARLAAVGQLAASVAHEINNPLYAARNCLHLLEGELPAELREQPYLRIARDELARIAGIIERMRDFYRPPRGELALCDLNQLVDETLTVTRLNIRRSAIEMRFAPAPKLPPVFGSGDQLRQVFLNLLLNAVDAMPDGGALAVRTLAGPSEALVEIEDSGLGIPDDIRAHLFEPFFTTKPSGTGLGLSISAHIVTQHGGQITVESRLGHGSVFRVSLPYQGGG